MLIVVKTVCHQIPTCINSIQIVLCNKPYEIAYVLFHTENKKENYSCVKTKDCLMKILVVCLRIRGVKRPCKSQGSPWFFFCLYWKLVRTLLIKIVQKLTFAVLCEHSSSCFRTLQKSRRITASVA